MFHETVERLSTIRGALLRELSDNFARYSFINTRLILSVGVNLNEIPKSPEVDAAQAKRALETLNKMGFLNREESRRGT
jgi:hypothetical protein